MKTITRTSLLSISLLSASLNTFAASDEWDFFPASNEDYKPDISLSLIGGSMSPDLENSDSGTVSGLEFALLCPLIKPPVGEIRQQASLTRYNENNMEITSFELNPHYLFNLSPNFKLGFGPGFGYVTADDGMNDAGFLSLQLGASAHYRINNIFLGAEIRQQFTGDKTFGTEETDMNNSRFLVKAGYVF